MACAECSPLPVSSADQDRVGSDADFGIVRLRGEHDIATVSVLVAILSQAVAAEGCDVVVDLREVEFMDASTIAVIVGVRNQLVLQSRALTMRFPSVFARRVLEVCGLAGLLDPGPAATDSAPAMGASGALRTWVAVAATQPAQRHDSDVSATFREANVPVVTAVAADSRSREGETEATADHEAR